MTNLSFHPTYARELLQARANLSVPEEVGLALRAHRRALGLSQRAYAMARGYARSTYARLESMAGGARLDDVIEALEGTGFTLYLGLDGPETDEDELAQADDVPPLPDHGRIGSLKGATVHPIHGRPPPMNRSDWPRSDLIARIRNGSRRFPAHHETTQVSMPPMWWWIHEYFIDHTNPPQWYAPRHTARQPSEGDRRPEGVSAPVRVQHR